MSSTSTERRRWLVPAILGLIVSAVTAPLAGSAWRRADVLEALTSGPEAVSTFSSKEAAVAAALTPAQTAQTERAKAVLFGMIAGMALLPLLPFLRTWLAERRTRTPSEPGHPPLFRP